MTPSSFPDEGERRYRPAGRVRPALLPWLSVACPSAGGPAAVVRVYPRRAVAGRRNVASAIAVAGFGPAGGRAGGGPRPGVTSRHERTLRRARRTGRQR